MTKSIKIAYCVICHKYTPVLEALIEWLGEGNDFYIHVDGKVDISSFEPLRRYPNVFFVDNRIKVYWGGYSQIESYLSAIGATRRDRYDYIALISGDTLPLRSNTEIKRFLAERIQDEYVIGEIHSDKRFANRITYRYPQIGNRYRTELIMRIRARFHLFPKRKSRFVEFSKGPNWIIITPAFRDYAFDYLDRNPWYIDEFAQSLCGDEMFFQMLIMHSPFASRVSHLLTMYADWDTGAGNPKPRTMNNSDFERLTTAKSLTDDRHYYLFARKIDDAIDIDSYRKNVLEHEC